MLNANEKHNLTKYFSYVNVLKILSLFTYYMDCIKYEILNTCLKKKILISVHFNFNWRTVKKMKLKIKCNLSIRKSKIQCLYGYIFNHTVI